MFHKCGGYFGATRRPRQTVRRTSAPQLAVTLETLEHDLTVFKVHFGNLTLKAYTKGERVLRFEAIVHNTRDLGCGRVVARFPTIVVRLRDMLERFLTTLDCVDVAFIRDDTLDQLPLPSVLGKARVGGVDLDRPRIRTVLAAVLALAASPTGFSVSELTAKITNTTADSDRAYTRRQTAYDLKKLRAKGLITKMGRSRRYSVQPHALRAVAAALILRDQVIMPLLVSIRSPRSARRPRILTPTDQHYEMLGMRMHLLFDDVGNAA